MAKKVEVRLSLEIIENKENICPNNNEATNLSTLKSDTSSDKCLEASVAFDSDLKARHWFEIQGLDSNKALDYIQKAYNELSPARQQEKSEIYQFATKVHLR